MRKRRMLWKEFLMLLPVLTILIFSHDAFAGTTGKLAGTVKDATTGEVLVSANVVILGTMLGAATDEDGYYFVINIPPGSYDVRVSMMGYKTETKSGVRINIDRTSTVDFNLQPTTIEGEAVTVTAERPVIRADLTASITEIDAQEIELSPAENLQDQIRQQRGILLGLTQLGSAGYRFANTPSDELHLRGGRENETAFLIDGMRVNDPLWGGSDYVQNTTASSITEMSTLAGTFNAEYGNAMSGVINVVAREGGENYKGFLSSYTDNLGIEEWDQNTNQTEFSLSGPVPFTNKKITFFVNGQNRVTDGYLYGYKYPNWVDSRGEDVDPVTGIPNGDPEKVSMNQEEHWNGMGKLTWRILPSIKLSILGVYSDIKESYYAHWFKYNPVGNPFHASEDLVLNLNLVHTLSASTFYELGFSRKNKSRFLGVYDNWDEYMQVLEETDPTGNWSVTGEDWTWHHDDSKINEARFALTSQITKTHLIKTGLNYRKLSLHRDSTNPNEVGMYLENYTHKPAEFAAYIQDKMEFSTIGMILNAGLRFELWNPDTPYWTDIVRLSDMMTEKASAKKTISPRFGVSYPVSDVAAFHFAYGHFYQLPTYTLLYDGQRYLTQKNDYYYDNPAYQNNPAYQKGKLYYPMIEEYDFRLANANMNPEKTVSYETGVQTKITEDISVDITAFYREMSDLVGERFVAEAVAGAGLTYSDNYDYGNAKGVEIAFTKRYSDYFSLRANYTFSKALITSSTPWEEIQLDNPTFRTFIANWDRPHTLSFDLFVGVPNNWGVSFYGNFQSGLPYSIRVEPNTERMPLLGMVDMRASKSFRFFGFTQTFFVRVLNLFDRKNIYSVYASSGKPDLPLGIERTKRNLNIYDDPSNYSPGRQVRMGFSVDF